MTAPNQAWPIPRLIYHGAYNISALGLERLHPFDSRKYGRAWNLLRREFGREINAYLVKPRRPARRRELAAVHDAAYLQKLREAKYVAGVLEIPQLARLPGRLTDWLILRPMRWAVRGTIIGAQEAIDHGLAINLSGGYHHASPDYGHGFSAYADAAIAIDAVRKQGRLRDDQRVLYIDLDAHQGNGFARCVVNDSRVFIYDQYNQYIFPRDVRAQRRIDCDVPLVQHTSEADYLAAIKTRLPPFIDSLARSSNDIGLAIYNAGTDVYINDQLGGLAVSARGVLERDQLVLRELINRRIPTLVLLSGGYSRESYQLVAAMASWALRTWGMATAAG